MLQRYELFMKFTNFQIKNFHGKKNFQKRSPQARGLGATTLLAGDYFRRYEITKVADADPWG